VENYIGPTLGKAFVKSAMQRYEPEPECNSTELSLLKRIKDLETKQISSLKVKKKMIIILYKYINGCICILLYYVYYIF